MEETKHPTTQTIRVYRTLLTELETNASKILTGSFLKPTTFQDRMTFVKEIAHTRSSLWEEVYKTYPEALGKDITITVSEVIIKSSNQ